MFYIYGFSDADAAINNTLFLSLSDIALTLLNSRVLGQESGESIVF